MDYDCYGSNFCVAGKDQIIKVYDDQTKKVEIAFNSQGQKIPGHSNKIFSIKYSEEDPNLIVSASWDKTMKIWDVR